MVCFYKAKKHNNHEAQRRVAYREVTSDPSPLARTGRDRPRRHPSEEVGLDKELTTRTVGALSRCSAVYDFVAELLASNDEQAQADYIHTIANGAASAAMYLLGQEHILAGNTPKPYGEFMSYVHGIAEAERLRLRALLESGDDDAFGAALEACQRILPQQEQLVQMLRNESIGR